MYGVWKKGWFLRKKKGFSSKRERKVRRTCQERAIARQDDRRDDENDKGT